MVFNEKHFSLSASESYCLETTTAISFLCVLQRTQAYRVYANIHHPPPLFNPNRSKHLCIFKNVF